MLIHTLAAIERSDDIDIQCPSEFLRVLEMEQVGQIHCGIIDQDIDSAQLLLDLSGHPIDLIRIRDIGTNSLTAHDVFVDDLFFSRFCSLSGRQVIDDDIIVVLGQLQRDRSAYPASAAGNQYDFVHHDKKKS